MSEIIPDKWYYHIESTAIDLVGCYTLMTTAISITFGSIDWFLLYLVSWQLSQFVPSDLLFETVIRLVWP
jgi:hypothetical protein